MESGFPGHFHVPANFFRRMDSPQIPEPPVVHALNSHGQPVDASRPVAFQAFRREGARIGLQGHFRIFRNSESAPDFFQNSSNLFRRQKGRRPSAKIDGIRLRNLSAPKTDFFYQMIHIPLPNLRPRRAGQKCTVAAFFYAEGNVDVNTRFIRCRQT